MTGSNIMMTCSFEDLKGMIREVVPECQQIALEPPENRLLTRKEACAFLHCDPTKLSECNTNGVVQGHRTGRTGFILESDVRAALREMPNRQKWKKARMVDEND